MFTRRREPPADASARERSDWHYAEAERNIKKATLYLSVSLVAIVIAIGVEITKAAGA